jgi:hypothetical protein
MACGSFFRTGKSTPQIIADAAEETSRQAKRVLIRHTRDQTFSW